MFCSVLSMGISGIQGYMVTVEVDCQRGMPRFELVGLPDAAVKEAATGCAPPPGTWGWTGRRPRCW